MQTKHSTNCLPELRQISCPYGITKGDLELRSSKVPRRTIALEKVSEQTQLAQVWQDGQDYFLNAEPAAATIVVNSHC
jgi:hypothetical protein